MSVAWFKSTFSGSETTCVEVAHRSDAVLIRDSKYPNNTSPIITVPAERWAMVLDLALGKNSGPAAGVLTVTVDQDGGATLSSDSVTLVFNADEWDAFAKGVADGQFDRR
ncbi:DUF397 domain-containing protein [Nocardia vinacea]|uniref:DUF397 domain-containing protein n=1 Tax=Nocardia vinacea TaxID=96468 RepID=UPI00344AFC6B